MWKKQATNSVNTYEASSGFIQAASANESAADVLLENQTSFVVKVATNCFLLATISMNFPSTSGYELSQSRVFSGISVSATENFNLVVLLMVRVQLV